MALPPISGQTPPRPPAVSDARAAAQRAFFEAALGRTPGQVPATAPVQAQGSVAAIRPPAPAAPAEPTANTRPGSRVNIVV
jgi:hypothetical protein